MKNEVKEDLRGLYTDITRTSNKLQAIVDGLPRGGLRQKAHKADVHMLAAREHVEQILKTEFSIV